MGLTAPVTWKNPHIVTNLWRPARLMPEAQITIQNLSAIASAAGVRADVFVFRFGVGFPRELIGGSQLSIEPAGQATFLAPFPQRIMNGEARVGVEVRVAHPTDLDAGNNVGLHAYEEIYTSEVGRQFAVLIPVRNPFPRVEWIFLRPLSTTDLVLAFTPTAGPFNPFEERMVFMSVDTRGLVPGPTTSRELHFIGVAGAAGERLMDDGLSFVINVDA